METVAVVGVGAMGSRIAPRLLDAGQQVLLGNRSPDKVGPLPARGATAVPTPGETASRSRTLLTLLAWQVTLFWRDSSLVGLDRGSLEVRGVVIGRCVAASVSCLLPDAPDALRVCRA